jgi:arsenite-transporting ATPase
MNPAQTSSPCAGPRTAARERPAFLQHDPDHLLLFGGKGGVGKTTCAVATALYLAGCAPDREHLLVSTDPAHSLEDGLAGVTRPPNLQVRELDARASLRRFKDAHGEHLRRIAERGTFLDNDDIGRFLDLSLPGLDELMAFLELAALAENSAGARVIVDTAPTGHTLRLLGLPDVLRKWLAALDAMLSKHRYLTKLYRGHCTRDDADRFLEELAAAIDGLASLLVDPQRCRFVPVMLAEPLVRAETVRLVQALADLQIPVAEIVVNGVYPPEANCRFCQQTRRGQMEEIRHIRRVLPDCPLWSIPLLTPQVNGAPRVTAFWDEVRHVDECELPDDAVAAVSCRLHWGSSPRVEHPAHLPAPETNLLFFAGKGGVGKTTLASATAVRLAQEYGDKQVLLLSTDPAHSLADCLEMPIGPAPVRLNKQLSAVEIDAEGELAELRRQYAEEVAELFGRLGGPAAGLDMTFDREVAARLIDLAPPGIDEVMALARVIRLLEAGTYDTLVCDTAPTGHLIRLLEMPALVAQWLGAFFALLLKYKRVLRLPRVSELLISMSRQLKALRAVLADPRRGNLQAVTIPSAMAAAETDDLLAACRAVGIHVAGLFVNMVRPAGDCALCDAVVQSEASVCTRLESYLAGATPVVVFRGAPPRGLARLAELGQALYDGGVA